MIREPSIRQGKPRLDVLKEAHAQREGFRRVGVIRLESGENHCPCHWRSMRARDGVLPYDAHFLDCLKTVNTKSVGVSYPVR